MNFVDNVKKNTEIGQLALKFVKIVNYIDWLKKNHKLHRAVARSE